MSTENRFNNVKTFKDERNIKQNNYNNVTNKRNKIIYISIGIFLLMAIISITIILVITKNKKKKIPSSSTIQEQILQITPKKKLEKEEGFSFKTEIGQLNTIMVTQQYNETTITKGKKTHIFLDRKTIYDIYVISESEPIGNLKYCYSKMYTCAISIVAECLSSFNDSCIPQTFLDLTGESIPNEYEIRNLQQEEDISDIVIPFCLFNITDNNAITGITCPESMSEGKIKGIVLDLYFYRPPGVKRVDKEKNNITITIEDLDPNTKLIRETNGGECEESQYTSFCSTDMNTTKDSNDNLLSYKERATTNIIKDEQNSYSKIKETSLVDITVKNNTFKSELYKEMMEKLLEKLSPNMHYYEQVSDEQFFEIYDISINGILPSYKKRKLQNMQKKGYTNEEIIFEYEDIKSNNIFLTMYIDSSYNSPIMRADSYAKFGEDQQDLLVNNIQKSSLTEILHKLIPLSKAGNYLATILYENIKYYFLNITQYIKEEVFSLNKLMKYKNITEIFDTTLKLENLEKLPKEIVDESNYLIEKINISLKDLETYNSKNKYNVISENIKDFLSDSILITNEISNNLKNLGKSMSSIPGQLTIISMHYLNRPTSSYMSTVQKAEDILKNYYKNEVLLIKSNLNSLINNFESEFLESIKNENNMIKELYQKIQNKTFYIENIDNDTNQKTINNLYNSPILINNTKNKIKELINKELDSNLKGEYFYSENEIRINNISFSSNINNAKNIADKFEKNKLVDEKIDEIMGYFRENFSETLISMETDKQNQFVLKEESLEDNLFKESKKVQINKIFSEFSKNAISEIKNDNEVYMKNINNTITDFLKKNEEELNSIINDLYILINNETLIELSNLYNTLFNISLNSLNDIIKNNEILAKEYMGNISQVVKNDTFILELVHSYKNDTKNIPYHLNYWDSSHYDVIKKWNETLNSKKITKNYKLKFNEFKKNFKYSEQYIKSQLYLDLINFYKNPIIKLRSSLQSIKNNNLEDKYPNLSEIFNNHKQIINILFNRIDNFLSDEIYNKNYLNNIKSYVTSKIKEINEAINFIQIKNDEIINNDDVDIDEEEYRGDYCVNFHRIKSYLCTNKVWHYSDDSIDYCLPLNYDYSNNTLKLKSLSINSNENLKNFNNYFDEFYKTINEKVGIYNSKLNSLKSNLINIENNLINKNVFLECSSSFQNELNSILKDNFGDKLINASYIYFQNIVENKTGNILNKVTNKWINVFDTLKEELQQNKNSFTYSLKSFSNMELIYYYIISQNISKYYYDSIIMHHKNEFNYTISYYYNYLLRLVKSTQNYITNRLLTNIGYYNNYFVNRRINFINNIFYNLIGNINLEENQSLNIKNQLKVLNVNENNFFKVNNIFDDNIQKTDDTLLQKYLEMEEIDNGIKDNEFSIIGNMYNEDLESGKQIINLYKNIYENNFIILNEEIFKDIIIKNKWVFNFDEFNNNLELKMHNLNKDINKEFLIHKENYTQRFENLINHFFTIDSIIQKINEMYKNGIKTIDNNMKNSIMGKIYEILNNIKEYLSKETIRLQEQANSYNNNFALINNTIKIYKSTILNKLNQTIVIVVNNFKNNMLNKFYYNYIYNAMGKFYSDLNINQTKQEYKLLNSSFNFNEIINNIVIGLQNKYNTLTRKQILYKYEEKLKEIYKIINLQEIKKIIDYEIDSIYENNLLLVLKKYSINNAGYKEYDLDTKLKTNINNIINEKIKNIENINDLTKGNNYNAEINGWLHISQIDFSYINGVNIGLRINDIKNDFENFIENEKIYEKNSINRLIEETIKTNFNNLLSYLIPSFGKNYFERIVKYNENFKIKSLYDNLRFSITATLSYYIIMSELLSEGIPKDLKIKLYNLNNLYSIVENNNNYILNKINNRIDDFINKIQKYILSEYSDRYISEFEVEPKFSEEIMTMIKGKISDIGSTINKICKNTLEKNLKEPFIISYKKVLNEKTYEMLRFAEMQKETIRINIINLKTIDSEIVLNKINENLNETEKSINKYINHLDNFKISNDFIQFLKNYGSNNILPLFSNIIKIINNAKIFNDNITLSNLIKNSKEYNESFNLKEFINKSNSIYNYFKGNYFNNMTEFINSYRNNYKEKLENEIERYNRIRMRRLNGEINENNYNEKVIDKSLYSTFENILSYSQNMKTFLSSFDGFSNLDEFIKKNLTIINENYKKSENIIMKKKENGILDDQLYEIYNKELINLDNMTKEYYIQINESYYNTKNYLNEAINIIDESLIDCYNITFDIISNKYNQIKDEIIPFYKNITTDEIESQQLNYSFNSSNNGFINYELNIENKKNAYFSLVFEVEKNNPILRGKVINLSGPTKMHINTKQGTTICGERKKKIDVKFGDIISTMYITWDTESSKINMTNIINYEDYKYTIKDYIIQEEAKEPEFIIINGIKIDKNKGKSNNCLEVPNQEGDDNIHIKAKYSSNEYVIEEE